LFRVTGEEEEDDEEDEEEEEEKVEGVEVELETLGNMLTVLLCSQVRGVRSSWPAWWLVEISCLTLSLLVVSA